MATYLDAELDREEWIADLLHDLSEAAYAVSIYSERPKQYRQLLATWKGEVAFLTAQLAALGVAAY